MTRLLCFTLLFCACAVHDDRHVDRRVDLGVDLAHAIAPDFVSSAADAALADQADAATKDDMSSSFQSLFDGIDTNGWRMGGQGSFVVLDGALSTLPGSDIGLLWSTVPTPPNFELRVEWRRSAATDNSGVFIRFPDPGSKGYDNTAYVGVDFGFEVQIDDEGEPDGAPMHRTGAIYDQPDQAFALQPSLPVGEWNEYIITVVGQTYTVVLNGAQVTQFVFTGDAAQPDRGLPSTPAAPRYIGLQTHTGLVQFRNVRIAALP